MAGAKKYSAYESGMRGSEKPKVRGNKPSEAANAQPTGGDGAGTQKPGGLIGAPGGVGLDAYSSGMRGKEKPKQKTPDAATVATGKGGAGGESKTKPGGAIGEPKGTGLSGTEDKYSNSLPDPRGQGQSMSNEAGRDRGEEAYELGGAGSNTEAAANGDTPYAEEDDTHINVRIPKTSLRKKTAGVHGN